LPDNKVALFIDFDNIRIGIRQHFGGELHPGKLMKKAAKYGRVTAARAYADFTGHPREFQDRLLFAAGIEPIHAPSKLSGGRRQSSADMHMVIDMFLEAVDHPDTDTFVLMTGDADFVRMVATLRHRFGRRVIVSGVQSTSTSLDLMNAADARDGITKQDCDMTGELGRMTRPLVTRADIDAAEAAAEKPQRGGILRGLFGRKPAAEGASAAEIPAPPPPVVAPRRIRASELTSGGVSTPLRPPAARTARAPRAPVARRPSARATTEPTTAARDSKPDDVEQRIVKEIFMMPPGRSGYTTMKTIEEVLRSKAGELGSTRKEIPQRLERLTQMGILKRVTRKRGQGEVTTGELAFEHPVVASLTSGMRRPDRVPTMARQHQAAAALEAADVAAVAVAPEDIEDIEDIEVAPPLSAEPPTVEPEAEEASQPFRWVAGPVATEKAGDAAETPAKKPATRRAPRKTAAKKPTTARPGTSRSRTKAPEEPPVPTEEPG
jgi:uncharacterized LabA/DUF88 family protein